MSGHNYDREHAFARPQAFQKLDTVDAWHPHVGDDAPKFDAGKRIEELMGGLEYGDVKVGGTKHEIERIPHRLVIVDDIDLSSM